MSTTAGKVKGQIAIRSKEDIHIQIPTDANELWGIKANRSYGFSISYFSARKVHEIRDLFPKKLTKPSLAGTSRLYAPCTIWVSGENMVVRMAKGRFEFPLTHLYIFQEEL